MFYCNRLGVARWRLPPWFGVWPIKLLLDTHSSSEMFRKQNVDGLLDSNNERARGRFHHRWSLMEDEQLK